MISRLSYDIYNGTKETIPGFDVRDRLTQFEATILIPNLAKL
jgi:hypothetical protein